MNKKYMTPDGEIITQKEIDAQKREEEVDKKKYRDAAEPRMIILLPALLMSTSSRPKLQH